MSPIPPPERQRHDPKLDLLLERVVDLPPEKVWAAWTTPELMVHWFTPAPWKTVHAEIDLRPGGIFRTVMESPEGEQFDNAGCILEARAPGRLVWTGALLPGFRPMSAEAAKQQPFLFSCVLTFEPHGSGTKYSALAIHGSEADAKTHEEMGFHPGWGAALDQLVALMRTR